MAIVRGELCVNVLCRVRWIYERMKSISIISIFIYETQRQSVLPHFKILIWQHNFMIDKEILSLSYRFSIQIVLRYFLTSKIQCQRLASWHRDKIEGDLIFSKIIFSFWNTNCKLYFTSEMRLFRYIALASLT